METNKSVHKKFESNEERVAYIKKKLNEKWKDIRHPDVIFATDDNGKLFGDINGKCFVYNEIHKTEK